MPELPEVQTLINQLLKKDIFFIKINDIFFIKEKICKNVSCSEFRNNIISKSITKIDRLGKYIIFTLDDNSCFAIHLRMEGKIIIEKKGEYSLKKSHLMFYILLNNDIQINYYDSRMFGTLDYYKNYESATKSKPLAKIAIDPLNSLFSGRILFDKFKNRNQAIKTILLDQTIVSGIGNIYANEILFASGINPSIQARAISLKQCNDIAMQAKLILQEAIKFNGTTIFSYSYDHGLSGQFQQFLKVHGRSGKACTNCNTIILKTKISGRSCYWCPCCQKK